MSVTQEQLPLPDRKDLKIQHYKEKVNQLEEALADTRVELTVVSQNLHNAQQKIAELENANTEDVQEEE